MSNHEKHIIDTDVDTTFGDTRISNESNISIELPEVKKDNKVAVNYNGVLNSKGADKVYLHYGFDGWKNADTIPMKKTLDGTFIAHVEVDGNNEMDFCFKDNANNWDNNSGANWKVGINSR